MSRDETNDKTVAAAHYFVSCVLSHKAYSVYEPRVARSTRNGVWSVHASMWSGHVMGGELASALAGRLVLCMECA